MTLEATVIIVDNSEWMRNGDFSPSRWESQADAVKMIFSSKTVVNQENTVAITSMAGKSPQVFVTLTNEVGLIVSALHKVQLGGKPNLKTSIQIALLVLKHRQNKNLKQRIIAFVGSPIEEDEKNLMKLAKRMKKNNVAMDIVSFGEDDKNQEVLETFIQTLNNNDNSHLITIPPGPHLLSDIIMQSPIGNMEGRSGLSGNSFEFGVDPNLDPELALALRLSLEEEKARQQATTSGQKEEEKVEEKMVDVPMVSEEDELSKALAMSMDNDVAMDDLSEEEQIARAIQMSMQQDETENSSDQPSSQDKKPDST